VQPPDGRIAPSVPCGADSPKICFSSKSVEAKSGQRCSDAPPAIINVKFGLPRLTPAAGFVDGSHTSGWREDKGFPRLRVLRQSQMDEVWSFASPTLSCELSQATEHPGL